MWLVPEGETAVFTNEAKGTALTISGEGAIPNNLYSTAVWKEWGITDIELSEGVTSIGSSAFYNCSKLTGVIIPSGVTSIGSDAFNGCSNYTIVGTIGSYAETYATANNITFKQKE